MSRRATSKARFKRMVQHRLRRILDKEGQEITTLRKGIVHANWGSGPDKNSFRDRYSVED